MRSLDARLLALHEALPHAPAVASTALALALGMASWIWRRGRALLAAKRAGPQIPLCAGLDTLYNVTK